MKRKLAFFSAAIVLAAANFIYFGWNRGAGIGNDVFAKTETPAERHFSGNFVVAPGIVEPVSEEIEVGAEIPGKIREILVEEGENVLKGQTIAILENADFHAQVLAAKSQIETLRRQRETSVSKIVQAKADRTRIENGARGEERREALQSYEQTLPALEQAKREVERRRKLLETGDVSREEFERAVRDLETANKQSLAMREKYNNINAAARKDDLQKADAAIMLAENQENEFGALIREAEARILAAEANLEKTIVRAPIAGMILRKRLKPGESVSPENQTGIVSIADVSAFRVRVDLDETDVAKVSEGQNAFVTADAYGEQKFAGKVVKIGQILGRKNFRTERPTEKVDTKILEVLIELEPGQKLPLGLRVDAFIENRNGQ